MVPTRRRLPSSGKGLARSPVRRPGFDVDDRHLVVERRQRPGEGRGGVALDQHDVGAALLDDRADLGDDARRELGECLAGPAQVEVDVGA